MKRLVVLFILWIAASVVAQAPLEPIPADNPASVGVDCCGTEGRYVTCFAFVMTGDDWNGDGQTTDRLYPVGDLLMVHAGAFCNDNQLCRVTAVTFTGLINGRPSFAVETECFNRNAIGGRRFI